MKHLRDVGLVAWFDLFESLRSKKAVALLVLYMAGAMAAGGIFVTVLREVENMAARALRVAETNTPGAMTDTLFASDQFREVVEGLVGDPEVAAQLLTMPPIALFYGWLALTFVPVLATLTSCDSVSSELATGSSRFSLFRTERTSWAVGKGVGQALLMAVGIVAGALGVYAIGWGFLASFEPVRTAWWLVRLGLRAWVYGLAWLGLALGISQATRSVPLARGLALLALVIVGGTGAFLDSWWAQDHMKVVADSLLVVFPRSYQLDLWRAGVLDRLPSLVMLPTLGAAWFTVGHAWFLRRDA